MSTATDLNDTEQISDQTAQTLLAITDTTTNTPVAEAHISTLAVPTVTLDQINNWTGQKELPFDPIAERLLDIEAHDEAGTAQKGRLSVTFARPLEIPGKGWACLYRLSAMGRIHVSPARGADAIDALQQAFTMVNKQLQGMNRVHRITFNGTDDLGFAPAGTQATAAAGCPAMNGSMSV